MGIQGTEVAKESSDIIILDDNFSSVVKVRNTMQPMTHTNFWFFRVFSSSVYYYFLLYYFYSLTSHRFNVKVTHDLLVFLNACRLLDGVDLYMQIFRNSSNSSLQSMLQH